MVVPDQTLKSFKRKLDYMSILLELKEVNNIRELMPTLLDTTEASCHALRERFPCVVFEFTPAYILVQYQLFTYPFENILLFEFIAGISAEPGSWTEGRAEGLTLGSSLGHSLELHSVAT